MGTPPPGFNQNQVSPGVLTIINGLGISPAPENAPEGLVVDAAEVNPVSSTS